ncbi:MAG: hypothetical protein Q8O40_13400, partial [Chloroflexota bacterium]|nr:hypothetical protein [Chloroflexota bacterium]
MKGALTAESRIYPNYTNYLYEALGVSAEDRYLLFNPSLHYWIAVEETGADIIRALPGMDLAGLRGLAKERLRIEEPQFSQDVVPFVSNLMRLGFCSTEKTPPSARWVPRNFSLRDPEHYPFNDLFISLVDACNLDCAYCFNKTARKRRLRQRPPT